MTYGRGVRVSVHSRKVDWVAPGQPPQWLAVVDCCSACVLLGASGGKQTSVAALRAKHGIIFVNLSAARSAVLYLVLSRRPVVEGCMHTMHIYE